MTEQKSPAGNPPSPQLFFDTINAHQRTGALKAAIELEIFTAIGEGKHTAAAIAARCGARERGARILCDYLVIVGFLTKKGTEYALTPDSALFLDKRSPAYAGDATVFLLADNMVEAFRDIAACVRKGGTAMDAHGSLAPEHEMWVKFARGMGGLMKMSATLQAQLINGDSKAPIRVLDIAAGHGMFGLAFAQANPNAQIVALDWKNVLEVARENAARAGVADRFKTIPGSALEVDLGRDYDIILLPNFLHHFDRAGCETILRRVYAALKSGGRLATLEFIPNADRISPPSDAGFSLVMLASTPQGDAYTFAELDAMLKASGFARNELRDLPPMQRVVISVK